MWLPRARRAGALAMIAAIVLGACGSKPPKPAVAKLTVAAQSDVNPDAAGRPSPVVVRVYQLKDDAAFKDADFFALFDKEQPTLAASLVARQEFVLAPGDHKDVEFPVSADAKFLGVAAAFRDIRNSDWRVLKAAPTHGVKDIVKKDKVSVVVGKSKVTLAVTD
jgi:type VI secretion system protein VasD